MDGYSDTLPDTLIRSNMDVGPAKVRQRISYGVQPVKGYIICTPSQSTRLESFYVSDLSGGSLTFNWKHPRSGDTSVTFQFVSPPTITMQDGYYRAELNMEIIP